MESIGQHLGALLEGRGNGQSLGDVVATLGYRIPGARALPAGTHYQEKTNKKRIWGYCRDSANNIASRLAKGKERTRKRIILRYLEAIVVKGV